MKKGLLLFAMALVIFSSCKEDETPEPTALSLEKNIVHATEYMEDDGMIELIVSGGTEPYTYAWSNGETTATIQGLTAGTYTVTITDAGMQTLTDETVITEPSPLVKLDSVVMGASYANDVYYSFKNGVVKTVDRTEWDLAFYTDAFSSSILINEGNGIELYVYPEGDTADWATVDTTGITWTAYYNDFTGDTWQNGAFDQTALGHPDYGWGKYDDQTHDVVGDSIHIVKFSDGTVKKLMIQKRSAMNNTFTISYDNLDNSDEQTVVINTNDHTDKNLLHFSFTTNAVVVHEPASEEWDFVITKYVDLLDNGAGGIMKQTVTGLLTNNGIMVSENPETSIESNDFMNAEYSGAINTIGYDWKSFNFSTFGYDMVEDLVYFVQDREENYYKLYFTKFESGMSTGTAVFSLTSY